MAGLGWVRLIAAFAAFAVFAIGVWSTPARADTALQALRAKPGQIKVDGSLRDWPSRGFGELGEGEAGSTRYILAYDDKTLFIAAEIHDDTMVRTKKAGRGEDALVLTLALPTRSGRYLKTEAWLYAGVVGETASRIALSPRTSKASAAKIVEGPLQKGQGVVLEASIPWQAFKGGGNYHLARAALRMQDVDRRGGKKSVSATARGKAATLPELGMQGGASEGLSAFRRERGIPGATPRHDFVGDVSGDRMLERVVIVGTHVVVLGAGGQFTYRELPVVGAADVRAASLQDLTGNGHPELAVTVRQQNAQGSRHLLQVMGFAGGGPDVIWSIETRKETPEGSVEASVELKKAKRKKPAQVIASVGESKGLSVDNYREQPAVGIEPILLPWGPVLRRVYAYQDGAFAVVEEEENPDAQEPSASSSASTGTVAPVRRPKPPPRAAPPGTDELVAAFRQAQGVGKDIPARFARHVNVAEDRRVESLMLFGKHLLVIGKGFRGGNGYFYFELPVAQPQDIQRIFTGDVTGDGRREVFVRFKQPVGDVKREILLAYTFRGGALAPILALEVRRAQGAAAVGNRVRLVRSGKHYALRIGAGTPQGWTRDSYPFVADGGDSYAPLLLPWEGRSVQYVYDGQQLRAAQ